MKKTNHFYRFCALALSCLLLISLLPVTQVLAEGDGAIHIKSAEDLRSLAHSCTLDSWSRGKTVVLDNDIELTDDDELPIPTFGGTFNGNGNTAEWEEEAARRGLPNKKNTPAALPALVDPKNIKLMEDFGVLTKVEMESRYEVEMEHYAKILNIEALTMLEMARKQLLPAVNSYMSEVANTAAAKLAVSEALSVRSETKTLTKLSADADAMSDAIDVLQDVVDAAEALTSESEKAVAFHDNVLPAMDALRAAADDAETICGEDYWPLPSYSKMLYYV